MDTGTNIDIKETIRIFLVLALFFTIFVIFSPKTLAIANPTPPFVFAGDKSSASGTDHIVDANGTVFYGRGLSDIMPNGPELNNDGTMANKNGNSKNGYVWTTKANDSPQYAIFAPWSGQGGSAKSSDPATNNFEIYKLNSGDFGDKVGTITAISYDKAKDVVVQRDMQANADMRTGDTNGGRAQDSAAAAAAASASPTPATTNTADPNTSNTTPPTNTPVPAATYSPPPPLSDVKQEGAQDCNGVEDCLNKNKIIEQLNIVINVLFGLIIAGSVLMTTIGGIQYITARDNAQNVANARQKILNVVIGLAFVAVLWAFLQWLIPGGAFK